ncbi:hypothetical protein [Pseudomonas phage D6]|nr:hypothetical protein [Pseudomonas phage D6]
MNYTFNEQELPFQLNTFLRFICKATVIRRQYAEGEHVNFSEDTVVRMVVPSDKSLTPFITATCPESGSTLRINVQVQPERALEDRNDAIAYLRRTLCNEAITVTERDLQNVERYGSRKHYTKEFFQGLIEKYQHRIKNFHTFHFFGTPVYD